jgi:two-component system, OmpR family, alkaline phosphatase synthesis response regulator PhoP
MIMTGKILICDDEPHIRRLIEQSLEELEDEGVELLTAADGEEAIGRIREEEPDLIILDVMMPRMNGFEVCEKVKSDKRLSSAYVMLLTAKGQEYDRHRGEEVGADRYMTKPFDPDDLLAVAREVLANMSR